MSFDKILLQMWLCTATFHVSGVDPTGNILFAHHINTKDFITVEALILKIIFWGKLRERRGQLAVGVWI